MIDFAWGRNQSEKPTQNFDRVKDVWRQQAHADLLRSRCLGGECWLVCPPRVVILTSPAIVFRGVYVQNGF
jgi:hypothetical protein